MAYLHARAYGRLYAVLMVGDDQRSRQLVRFPVLDPDGREDASEDVRFHCLFTMCLFHLRENAHPRLCLVPVLGGEDFLHLVIEIILLANVHHTLQDLIVIDALDRLAIDIILLVSTLESFKVHYFDSVVLKIKLLLFFQYCQCFHNLEFYKVNTMICLSFFRYVSAIRGTVAALRRKSGPVCRDRAARLRCRCFRRDSVA